MPHPVWSGPLPVCLAEHHQGKVRRLRLVLASLSHLTNAVEQRTAQDYTFEALHRIYFYDAWRTQAVLGAPESDLAASWPLDTRLLLATPGGGIALLSSLLAVWYL